MKLVGVVLAAGRSSRMGRPKALLPMGPGGEPFVTRLVTVLREGGVADVLVVVREDGLGTRGSIEEAVASASPAARVIVNHDADAGQLASVQAAVREVSRSGADGLLLVPVDMPLIRAATVARLVGKFEAAPAPIVRASHGGRHGHPVIFARGLFEELMSADPAVGARAVVRARGAVDVEVDDPGVLQDVDTPEDYERLLGRH